VVRGPASHFVVRRDPELDRGDQTPRFPAPLLVPVYPKPAIRSLPGEESSKTSSARNQLFRGPYFSRFLGVPEKIGKGKVPYRRILRLEEPTDSGFLSIQPRSPRRKSRPGTSHLTLIHADIG
jgi:hypothetical protein